MKRGGWEVRNYLNDRGDDPVVQFMVELNASGTHKGTAKIIRQIDRLRELGLSLGTDELHKIPNTNLWELLATWSNNPYRVLLYDAGGGMLILLSVFHKKTNAIPRAEIDLALRRMEDHQRRRKGGR